jgi:hypothetical protein
MPIKLTGLPDSTRKWFSSRVKRLPSRPCAALQSPRDVLDPESKPGGSTRSALTCCPILPPGHLSFLRGSDDYGCSNLFAGATALYVAFGVLASWHLTFRLSESATSASVLRDLLRALWILKFHFVAFLVGGWEFSERGGCASATEVTSEIRSCSSALSTS